MTTIYYNNNHDNLLINNTFADIKPGDIILFSAVGKHRKARPHDRAIMFFQSIFRWKYHTKSESNAGITHAAICVSSSPEYGPMIREINRGGYSAIMQLTGAFSHTAKTPFLFRPMHIFRPKNKAYRDALVESANEGPKGESKWSLSKAAGALFTRCKKTRTKDSDKDKKAFKDKTHCSHFVVRAMKNAARSSGKMEYLPNLHTNISPSALLSYLLHQSETDKYSHSVYVDIDPYQGIQDAIKLQITRLAKARSSYAQAKSIALIEALENAVKAIDETDDPLTKARALFKSMSKALQNKERVISLFKPTAFVEVERYLKRSETYTKRLR